MGVVGREEFRRSGVGLNGISQFRRCGGWIGEFRVFGSYLSIQYRNRPQLAQRQIFLFLSLSVARAMGMTW